MLGKGWREGGELWGRDFMEGLGSRNRDCWYSELREGW